MLFFKDDSILIYFDRRLQWMSQAIDILLLGGGNSNIFYFHPYLGKIPILTHIISKGVETTNEIKRTFEV